MTPKTELESSLLQALKNSEERFRNLVENSSDWIWEVDQNAVYTYCSPRCFDLIGYQPEELLGKTPFDFMPAEEARRVVDFFKHITAKKTSFSRLENINVHKEGHQVVLETNGNPFFDDQGKLLGYRGIDRDITDRKTAEIRITRQAEIIDQIHDSVISTDLEGFITCWNKGAERLFGVNKEYAIGRHIGFVYPKDEQTFHANQIIAPAKAKGFHDTRVRMLRRNGEIFHAHLSLSVLYDEHHNPMGMISFTMDVTSQVIAEEALRVSEKNLEVTLNSIGDAVIVTDTRQKITRINPVAEQLSGWPLREALGQPIDKIFNICNSETQESVINPVAKVIAEKKINKLTNHTSLITRNGTLLQISDSAAPIIDEANIFTGVVLVFQDVSTQYQTQRDLRKRNQQFSAFVSAMPDIAFVLDENGKYIEIYGSEHQLLYKESNLLLGKTVSEVLPDQLAKIINKTIQKTLKTEETQVIEYEVDLKQGNCYFEGRVSPMITDIGRNRRVIWLAKDISEKKRALQSLQISEQRFRQIFEKMPNIAVQGYNQNREVIFWNKSSESIYGYTEQEALGRKVEDLIVPTEYTDKFVTEIENYLHNDIPIPASEIMLQRKNGSRIPVFSNHIKLGNNPEQAEIFCIDIDLTETKKANAEIERLAYYDPLTHLPNRRLFLDRLSQEQKTSKRHSLFASILFLDLDHFKTLNDSLGHSIGDLLLIEIGQRMQRVVREEDTVARLGGDEFVVLLKELAPDQVIAAKQARHIAEKIMLELTQPIVIQQHEHIITTSIGITLFNNNGISPDTLLKQADTAMYKAKKAGRNTFQFFQPNMQVDADARLALEKDLRQALRKNELKLFYQPQFDAQGMINGGEALLRWQHPSKGIISPAEFIPVAEETGLIIDIGNWVISSACKQIQLWENQGLPENFHLAINVSPKQFRLQEFVPNLKREIKSLDIKPKHITLELTENIVIDNIQQTIIKMQELKSTGVKFSIDDFGTGYSSLVYLKQLPLDQLKIDQAFVQDILVNQNNTVIVETIITMAKLLGFQVIAEGVESEHQLQFLQALNCQHFQGNYFSKPLPEAEFTSKLMMTP